MYEAAIRNEVKVLDRKGNWVQKFLSPDDALLYATAPFYRYQEAQRFVIEHLSDSKAVARTLAEGKRP